MAAERRYDLAIAEAWHAAKFNGLGQNGKLRGLSSYLGKKPSGKTGAAQAIAFFHSLKAKGIPVEIRRTPRKQWAE